MAGSSSSSPYEAEAGALNVGDAEGGGGGGVGGRGGAGGSACCLALGFGPGLDLSGRFWIRPLSLAERMAGVFFVKPAEEEEEVGDDDDDDEVGELDEVGEADVAEKDDRRGSSAIGSDRIECRSIESKSRCP